MGRQVFSNCSTKRNCLAIEGGKEMNNNNYLQRSQPEEQGLSSTAIVSFLDAIEREKIELHTFMLLRHGKVIAEGAWSPYETERKQFAFSLTKSITSTAVGFAISEGLLSLDDKVLSFFPEFSELAMDKKMEDMTVRHLLTMTSGYFEHIRGSTVWSHMKESWVKEFLELPLTYKPGAQFVYNSGSSHMLSAIVTKVTKQPLSEYLQSRLFDPLHIKNFIWDIDPEGNNSGGWGIRLATEDIAKFGQFYLQKGMWENKQLLSREWIEAATSFQVSSADYSEELDSQQGYGYQFWMCRNGAYRGLGKFGQICMVLPQQNAVIAITAGTHKVQRITDLIWEYLYPGFRGEPLAENVEAQKQLKTRLNNLALFAEMPYSHSTVADTVSGKQYQMKTNEDAIHAVQFDFSAKSCMFTLVDHDGKHQIECGIDEWVESETTMPGAILHYMQQPDDLRVKARGIWKDEKTFIMTWTYILMPFTDTVICQFEGDKIIFRRSVNVNGGVLERPTIIGDVI